MQFYCTKINYIIIIKLNRGSNSDQISDIVSIDYSFESLLFQTRIYDIIFLRNDRKRIGFHDYFDKSLYEI